MPKLSTIFASILLFIVFLLIQLPYQNARGYIFGKIYALSHVIIVASDISPAFFGWPGLGFQNVDVSIPIGSNELEVSAKKMVVRVGLGGIFPPAKLVSLNMKGLKKGGDLFLKFCDSGAATKAAIEADELQLDQIAFSGLSEPIKGKLNLDSNLYLDKAELSRSSGDADLSVDKLNIPAQNLQGFVLPSLAIGDVKSKIRIKNGMADIQSFQFGSPGADLSGSLTGDVRLGKDLMTSILNLTLRLQLSENYRKNPQAATLVSLLESFRNKKGEYAMKWSASLGDMTTNLMSAIPQKLPD